VARTAVHRIGIVVFDGVKLLDVAGPSEVFSEATRMGRSASKWRHWL
jgi:putative intracellular protease/amidase